MTRRRPQQLPISGPVFFFFVAAITRRDERGNGCLPPSQLARDAQDVLFPLEREKKMETNCVKKRGIRRERMASPVSKRKKRKSSLPTPCSTILSASIPRLIFELDPRTGSKIERTVGKEEEIYKRLGIEEGRRRMKKSFLK